MGGGGGGGGGGGTVGGGGGNYLAPGDTHTQWLTCHTWPVQVTSKVTVGSRRHVTSSHFETQIKILLRMVNGGRDVWTDIQNTAGKVCGLF